MNNVYPLLGRLCLLAAIVSASRLHYGQSHPATGAGDRK